MRISLWIEQPARDPREQGSVLIDAGKDDVNAEFLLSAPRPPLSEKIFKNSGKAGAAPLPADCLRAQQGIKNLSPD